MFFGRRGDVAQLAGLLRSPVDQAVLLVMGPAGCGKSSLVRAGLLPVMAEEPGWWTLPPMLPGTDPVAALSRGLAATGRQQGLDWTVAEVRHRLDDDDGGLKGLADELLLATRARRLLLVVDQFEELLTQSKPSEGGRFAQLLRPALGAVQVVATLRPEFLNQLLADAELAVLPTRTYTLRPLRREALPLLAFTLARLADGVGRGGQLSATRYEQLDGVQGALTRQANAALTDATAATRRSREEVIAGLLRLVTMDEQGRPTQWRIAREELPEPVTRELDAFITRRLVITDTENDTVVVGVAHEAFLSAWPPLAKAIEENASALRARREIEQAATEWDNEGGPRTRLWERGRLAAALADTGAHLHARDVVTDRIDLSRTAQAFLRASIRRDRLRRIRLNALLSVLLVVALVAAVIAFILRHAAEQQRDVALSRQVAGEALEMRATDPALSAQLSLAAYRLDPTTDARGSVLSTFAAPYATELRGHANGLTRLAFSPDGNTVATADADHTALLWDISVDRVKARICHITPAITKADWGQYLPHLAYRPPCP